MTLAHDLLDQARQLARHEPKRPKQASLRRAVSTAYYALFHMLIAESAGRIAPRWPPKIEQLLQRTFDHAHMKDVCKGFASGSPSDPLSRFIQKPMEIEIRALAKAFVDLQQARHAADYDTANALTRQGALTLIDKVADATHGWKAVRTSANANLILLALVVPKLSKSR